MFRARINVVAARRFQLASSPSFLTRSATPGPSCASGAHRSYSSPTSSRSRPQAAVMTEAAPSYNPSIVYTSSNAPRRAEPHRFEEPNYPVRQFRPLQLPSPIPDDGAAANASQAELYKSTSAIDTISMLSICSSRPEFVPRAFQIFFQLIQDAKAGQARYPDAEVWANVIKGVAGLGGGTEKQSGLWRQRASQLVQAWEESQGAPKGVPALESDGIRVYRRWLLGLVNADAPLDTMLQYLDNQAQLPLERLVDGFVPSDLDKALTMIHEMAQANGRADLAGQVAHLQGQENEKRERKAREVVEEVKPVLETSKPKKRNLSSPLPELVSPDSELKNIPQARFTISNLRGTLAQINAPLSAYNRQMQLEQASYAAAEAELLHSAKKLEEAGLTDVIEAQKMHRDGLQSHMHRWHVVLTEYLEKDVADMRERVTSDAKQALDTAAPTWSQQKTIKENTLLLYLTTLPPKKLALITILEIMRLVGSGGIQDGMKTLRGMISVGKAVETEYRAATIRSIAGPESYLWQKTLDKKTQLPSRANIGSLWAEVGRKKEADESAGNLAPAGDSAPGQDPAADLRSVWTPPWSNMVQMAVGAHLVSALLQVAKVTRHGKDRQTGEKVSEEQPALNHSYEYVHGRKLGVIRLNPVIASRLANDSLRPVLQPKHLPMLIPPRPWTAWNDGAYLATPVSVMRFKDSVEQVNYLREASKSDHLTPVFHGLDVLSSTPWAINRKVFDVVLQAWNTGEAFGDFPPSAERAHYEFPPKPDPADSDPVKRQTYIERVKAVTLQQRKDHGERCKYNYTLEIARSFLNDLFYIPHNMDFRGRAYPIPPHLSPVGDDLSRGLLTFGVKKPLGSSGLKWLQIHLANTYGYDKASFEERARFAEEHEADIFDSADKPTDGNRWWLQAEDPWQCLATCFELAAALRSGDPTKYECSLPVHQDGTCNGMQHYAALGGDVRGAKAVNLEKGDRPADIYSGVAELVNKSIQEDRKNNIPLALLIDGELGRKVVKQTVMTTVYGVTFIGARDQIAKQLVARGGINPEDIYMVSAYVARKVLASIGDLFFGAKAIMDWLAQSARMVARSIPPERVEYAMESRKEKTKAKKAKNTPASRLARELMTSVIWTSPLGLPVVQPYRKAVKKQVMTSLQSVYIHDPNAPSEVSPQKQSTAFPPNFIHSLDATHMLLTAVRCNQSNINFASVHDSYWTHPSTVEAMSEAIRDTFIHLHSQDLIGELREEFLERYGDNLIPINTTKKLARKTAGPPPKFDTDQPAKDALEAELEARSGSRAAAGGSALGVDADDGSNEKVKEGEEGIDASEMAKDIPVVKIGTGSFVRVRDMLPAQPARGQFDVNRIRESAYFFS